MRRRALHEYGVLQKASWCCKRLVFGGKRRQIVSLVLILICGAIMQSISSMLRMQLHRRDEENGAGTLLDKVQLLTKPSVEGRDRLQSRRGNPSIDYDENLEKMEKRSSPASAFSKNDIERSTKRTESSDIGCVRISEPRNSTSPKGKDQDVPVVFVHVKQKGRVDMRYIWEAICCAQQHGNKVIFITSMKQLLLPLDLSQEMLDIVNTNELNVSSLWSEFKGVYNGNWSLREPWERINMRRFFLIEALMRRDGIDHVFYADSDVALRTKVSLDTLKVSCDALISIGDDLNAMDTYRWSAWAGSAILSRCMLSDFLSFATEMYSKSTYREVLRTKFLRSPYVTDMTHWYLFLVATDAKLAKKWSWNSSAYPLPHQNTKYTFCDGGKVGFDHRDGHKRNDSNLLSIHYQGREKLEMTGMCISNTNLSTIKVKIVQ